MEPKGDMPDFSHEPGRSEFDFSYRAAELIWAGINAYWGDGYTETTSYRDSLMLTQTRETEEGLVSYELQAGYITEDEDEVYEGEGRLFIGTLLISVCKDSDDLTDGLKELYENSKIEVKKSLGKTDEEIELDPEIREIKYQPYYSWEVSEYSFYFDEDDGVDAHRCFQLRNSFGQVVWSSRVDEEPDEPILTELDSQDRRLENSLSEDDYYGIRNALTALLNIPPEFLEYH